jgi:hypothetical protein
MSNLPALPANSLLDQLRNASDPATKTVIQRALVELVEDERFPKRIPRFMAELPFVGTTLEIQLRIGAAMFTAEDPDRQQEGETSLAAQEIIGKTVTVWDLRAAPSDTEGDLGGYLLLDIDQGNPLEHMACSTGAPAAIIRLATAWVYGKLPLTGAFAIIPGTGGAGRKPAYTFMAETPL